MPQHITEGMEAFGEKLTGTVSSSATKQLFDVGIYTPVLDSHKQDIFHSVVAHLLRKMKRVHPDLECVILFLCTFVSCSTEEDWNKLYWNSSRMIENQYMKIENNIENESIFILYNESTGNITG